MLVCGLNSREMKCTYVVFPYLFLKSSNDHKTKYTYVEKRPYFWCVPPSWFASSQAFIPYCIIIFSEHRVSHTNLTEDEKLYKEGPSSIESTHQYTYYTSFHGFMMTQTMSLFLDIFFPGTARMAI